ncbi:MAG: DUF4175 family protein, partial [Phycisphaerae bacterium]
MSVLPVDSLQARLAQRIFSPLAQLRRRCRLYLALDGLVRFYLALMGASLAQLLLDWWLKLSVDQRAVLDLVIALFWLMTFYRHLLTPLLRPLSDRSLALAVDRAHPDFHDQIAAAVQFARGQVGTPDANSPQLVRAVMEDACEAAPRVPFMAVLDHRRAKQRAVELAGLLLTTLFAFFMMPDLTGTWLRRNWLLREVPWPQQTHITPIGFEEGRRRMPRGEELEIAAVNRDRVPNSVELRWWTASGREGREPMTLIGVDRWEASLGLLLEDVFFRIVGGDERTRQYAVIAVERPRVIRTAVRITPPAYTGLDPVTLQQQTVLEVLQGSALEIDAQLNRPVASARFVGIRGRAAPCSPVGPNRIRVEWNDPVSGSYSFELVDRDGYTNRRPVRYTLKVVPDLPPEVGLELPAVGESITPPAELPIELSFVDTYGLGEVALYVQRADDPPFDVPLAGFVSGRCEFAVETSFAVTSLSAAPGDRVRIWAQASDQDPRGPNVGRTRPVGLRVVSPTDFLAELAGRELQVRREFERLISAQRGVKDALQRLLPELPDEGATPAALAQRLAGLARRQDAHAHSCLNVCRRFEQMLGEMRLNKVARSGDERRIGERIVAPLKKLGSDTMPVVSAVIAETRREVNRARVETLPDQQADILRQMGAILANMLEWEGYREAVALLQEIIAAQTDVRAATVQRLEQQLEAILGLDDR